MLFGLSRPPGRMRCARLVPYKDNIDGWNRSQFFAEFNTSKRSLTLDLSHKCAGEVTKRILEWADVVVESFTPGNRRSIGDWL